MGFAAVWRVEGSRTQLFNALEFKVEGLSAASASLPFNCNGSRPHVWRTIKAGQTVVIPNLEERSILVQPQQ